LIPVCIALPRIAEPFDASRLRWYYNNAAFLRRVMHSLDDTIPDPRNVFGLAITLAIQYTLGFNPERMADMAAHRMASAIAAIRPVKRRLDALPTGARGAEGG
jgi:hypothetical protein